MSEVLLPMSLQTARQLAVIKYIFDTAPPTSMEKTVEDVREFLDLVVMENLPPDEHDRLIRIFESPENIAQSKSNRLRIHAATEEMLGLLSGTIHATKPKRRRRKSSKRRGAP